MGKSHCGKHHGYAQNKHQNELGDNHDPDAGKNIDGSCAAVRKDGPGKDCTGYQRGNNGQAAQQTDGFGVCLTRQGLFCGNGNFCFFLFFRQPVFYEVPAIIWRLMGFLIGQVESAIRR